jgi:hypothetical protein
MEFPIHGMAPQAGISILAVPVGTSYTPNVFRVGRMCSWPILQGPDTVCGVHRAVSGVTSRLFDMSDLVALLVESESKKGSWSI